MIFNIKILITVDIFKNYLVIEERTNGLTHLNVKNWNNNKSYYIEFDDPVYTITSTSNPEFDTNKLRFVSSKLIYDFNNHNDAYNYLAVALLSLTTMSCRDKPLYSAVFTNFWAT